MSALTQNQSAFFQTHKAVGSEEERKFPMVSSFFVEDSDPDVRYMRLIRAVEKGRRNNLTYSSNSKDIKFCAHRAVGDDKRRVARRAPHERCCDSSADAVRHSTLAQLLYMCQWHCAFSLLYAN